MTNPSIRLHMLYTMRSHLDLMIAMEEGIVLPDGPAPCPHPEEKRKAVNNMGEEPAFMCFVCGQVVKGQA